MKKCEKCNEKFVDEMNFCPMCGSKLVESGNVCKSCGKEVPRQFIFCPNCGNSMVVAGEKLVNVNDEELQVEDEGDNKDLFDNEDDGKLEFKIGNYVFSYYGEVDVVRSLRVSCLNAYQILKKSCEDYLKNFTGIIPLLNDNIEGKLENTLKKQLKLLVDEFVKLGYYDLDFDLVWRDYTKNRKFKELKEYFECVRESAMEIEEWVQSEKDRREYRKETRIRLAGGGFGLKAAAVGMAKAGAVNITTGAAHSVFNFFGNLSTDHEADEHRNELFKYVNETLPILFATAGLNFNYCIEDQIGISYDSSNIDKINDKIEEGLISENDIIPILVKNINCNPFVSRTYKILMKHMSEEFAYDIYEIASYFKLTSDDGKLHYVDDDYTFLEEFECGHTFFNKFVDNKDEYDEIKNAISELLKLRKTYEVEEFFDDSMRCCENNDVEETIETLVLSGNINELRKIKESITRFKQSVRSLNGEDEESVELKLRNFVLCDWYFENLIAMCDKVILSTDKGIAIVDAMHNGDVKKFIELDSERAANRNRGWDYMCADNPQANDIMLCYFLLGAANKDSECEFGIGLMYKGKISVDDAKCKFWLKLSQDNGCKKVYETLKEHKEILDKGKNIDFGQAIAGIEFKGTFTAYALPSYIKKWESDCIEKQRPFLERRRIEKFFALDYDGIDDYAKAKQYAEMEYFASQGDIVLAYHIKGAISGDAKCQYQVARYFATKANTWSDVEKLKYWMIRASQNGLSEATIYITENKQYFDNVNNIRETDAFSGIPLDYIFTNYVIEKKLNTGKSLSAIDKNNYASFKELDGIIHALSQETSFYVHWRIDKDKLSHAFSNYASNVGIDKEEVVFHFDSTFFGGGEDGFVLAERCLVSDHCRDSVYYSELEYVVVKNSKVYIKKKYDNNETQFTRNLNKNELRIVMEAFYKLLGGKVYFQNNADYLEKIEF